jgi:hypothetical protein
MIFNLSSAKKIYWTKHSKRKMREYQLSEKRVLRVLKNPDRLEEGIAPGTIAVMERAGTKKHPKEIWVMYQIKNQNSKVKNLPQKLIIISTWRYPGKSPIGKPPPIPEDVLRDLPKLIEGDRI